ncbi:Aspercryptin biosynthesis cluster I [Hyphodiscus hymeniophilus]|uniref:Aspercryptin biosynthesis cluster I n=1 Tax=Hyphodiscus hymeniophilus TaxID=353542 RepID=A0A9P6SNM3_9HELO|nr:Aspercryptin biosynthesis cluster I [Hyphodiscus hymeniophilus]
MNAFDYMVLGRMVYFYLPEQKLIYIPGNRFSGYFLDAQGQYVESGWKRMLFILYASLALITIRIIYRLIEYASGNGLSNPLPYHEAYFYCLDACPMFLAALIMCVSHPGHFLKGPNSEFPKWSRKEKKAA